jgi:hypothetical protein
MSTYADQGPSFQPDNPRSNQIARFHDLYLTTIQNCLYKPAPPFGIYGDRKQALAEYSKQLYVIADLMEDDAMYACGDEVALADATLFPSVIFAVHMFPKFDSGLEKPVPPKIEAWFQGLIEKDSAFKKAYDEVGYVLSISIPSLNPCLCVSPSACISLCMHFFFRSSGDSRSGMILADGILFGSLESATQNLQLFSIKSLQAKSLPPLSKKTSTSSPSKI